LSWLVGYGSEKEEKSFGWLAVVFFVGPQKLKSFYGPPNTQHVHVKKYKKDTK
jgi:hypothetical protein